jgi:hypothetical protein
MAADTAERCAVLDDKVIWREASGAVQEAFGTVDRNKAWDVRSLPKVR